MFNFFKSEPVLSIAIGGAIAFTLLLVVLASIFSSDSDTAEYKNQVYESYKDVCIDNVVYLYKQGVKRESITVKFDTDSKVIVCTENYTKPDPIVGG